jgi:hypothetical protein
MSLDDPRFSSNPRVLLAKPFSVFPSRNDSPSQQINSVVRLSLYIGGLISLRAWSYKPLLAALVIVVALEFSGGFDAFFMPSTTSANAEAREAAKYDETKVAQPTESDIERMASGPESSGRRVTVVPTEQTKQFSTRPPAPVPPSEMNPSDVDVDLADSGLAGVLAHGGLNNRKQDY